MDWIYLIYLSSGLFLGWSLGANDAANIFGTAVGTKMVKFRTAAIISSIFVILGAVYTGAGASQTLGKLGSVNAIAGAFMVAFPAALTIYWMVLLELPVSTSQAIVGAIVGWNIYSHKPTELSTLSQIAGTWIICPILSGIIAIALYLLFKYKLRRAKTHLLRRDTYTRIGLIIVGAFGAYALGANNIANVMGVFVPSSPFQNIELPYGMSLNSTQVLFLIGGIAISSGIITYSKNVMNTVGNGLMNMSPFVAWIAVFSQALVLFLFASQGLKDFLTSHNLPSFPLVPVSSSQAIIGAVIGIGLLKGGRDIHWGLLGRIALGWVATPLISAVVCFISLFFLANVFNLTVYLP